MSDKKMTFKQGYEILKKNANNLKIDSEPDIDALVGIMKESTEAYHACMDRINLVKKALAQYAENNNESDDVK